MNRIFAGLLAAWVFVGPAFADSTINNLGAGSAVRSTDIFPAYQGANPATGVTAAQLQAFMQGLVNVQTYAPGISINDGSVHTVGTAPAGTVFNGVTTLAGLAAITLNGAHPFFFLTDSGTLTGPMCTPGSTTNCFLNGVYALTNSSVANMDIGWLAIQAAILQGKAYIPAGKYSIGSTENLPLMVPLASQIGAIPQGVPTTISGDGNFISLLQAGHDFGAGIPLMACGDPAGTSGNSLGRYANSTLAQCQGNVMNLGLTVPSCTLYPAPGTTVCGMTGIATGARLNDYNLMAGGFGVNIDIVGDNTTHINMLALGGVKGIRWNVQNVSAFGGQQFYGLNASGQSFASLSVAPGASIEANFNGYTYLSGMYGILGEAASGGGCTAILFGVTFDALFTEFIGNETIADDSGFGSQTSSLTATNASPAVFTGTANVYYNGNKVVLSGGTAPAGFTLGTTYYAVNATPGSGTFNLALTQGGSSINSTSTGSGFSGTSGVYTDANKCRNVDKVDIVQWQNSFLNSKFDTTGSGRGRRATFEANQFSMNISRMVADSLSLTPNLVAATFGPPPVAFINARGIGDSFGGITLGGDVTGLISELSALPIAAGDSNASDYASINLQSAYGWAGSVGIFQTVGNYTTTVAGDVLEIGGPTAFSTLAAGGTNLTANTPAAGISLQSGITNNEAVPYANSGIFNVNTGWNTSFFTLLGKSTGIGPTLTIVPGSGYTNGTYTWTATGGGCSTEPIGTVTVAGAVLTSATIGASTQGVGCTSVPTIPIPGGAGAGTGGSITPRWPSGNAVNISTMLTNGALGITVGGNNGVGGGGNFLTTKLQGLR